ncbi:hypothetical protein [Rhodopseudomonas palustris]
MLEIATMFRALNWIAAVAIVEFTTCVYLLLKPLPSSAADEQGNIHAIT